MIQHDLNSARKQAHANLLQQAQERARTSLAGLSSKLNPANASDYRALGMNQQAANLFEARHPAAMEGRANLPDWVVAQMTKQLQSANPGGQHQFLGSVVSPNPTMPGSNGLPVPRPLPADVRNGFMNGGGGFRMLPERPLAGAAGGVEGAYDKLIHLGQGIFLHPGTGEIHGLGGPLSQSGGPMGAVHPGPVAF